MKYKSIRTCRMEMLRGGLQATIQEQQAADEQQPQQPQIQPPKPRPQQTQQLPSTVVPGIRNSYHDVMAGTSAAGLNIKSPSTSPWDASNWHYPWSDYWSDKKNFPQGYTSPSQPKEPPQWKATPGILKKLPGAETI